MHKPGHIANLSSTEKRELLARLLHPHAQASKPRDGDIIYQQAPALERHRRLFPALANKDYFNYGAHGPLSRPALEAIVRSFEYAQASGPFSFETNIWVEREIEQARASIASELRVAASSIVLTESISVGCNIVLWGIDWRPGDHLLISDCENPGIVAAVEEVKRRFNLEVSVCPLRSTRDDSHAVAAVARHLKPSTRLVVLSHVFWNTGEVMPLAEISRACHDHSTPQGCVRILVDGAQSVGVLPLDLTLLAVDFYSFTGQKWWCGPEGVAGLYISPEASSSLQPTFVGWRSLDARAHDSIMKQHTDGRRFEIGSAAYPLYSGLREALAIHHEWGSQQERYDRVCYLSRYFRQRLVELANRNRFLSLACLQDAPPRAGIIPVQLSGRSPIELARFLESKKVIARAMADPACLRVCVHYLTLEPELDRLVEEIEKFCTAS